MTYDKKDIMKQAWVLARNFSFTNGGTAKEWFGYALKQRWDFVKLMFAPKKAPIERVAAETKVSSIKNWFVDKNFDLDSLMIYQGREKITTLQETAKAVFVKISNVYGKSFTTWVPKSCLA